MTTRRNAPMPTLEHHARELQALALPGAQLTRIRGVELRYCFEIAPSPFSQLYKCLLVIRRNGFPDMYVISPDIVASNAGKPPPHIYKYDRPKTKLCLWWPKAREWRRDMKFAETYIPWAAEWLFHYEYWLATGVWEGGGVHPPGPKEP
ncbi:hypothetical protein [Paraburkholderia azotifigens]|uniref:Type II CBASS E2 protein domain-containing protein n=1 Tax=Paraburkholderia azotifigens TaxID=2057004 RepID=A0A5C6V362_9BURK|nr:hypothetical protein [Paraburkholderia azotifigens]TXC79121.1 hypothetical protein FRZ40_32395 [Paraburkholderia azotifigens]